MPRSTQWVADRILSILKSAPGAVRATKQLLDSLPGAPWDEALATAQTRSAELFGGAEAAEGMDAFLAKRSPSWDVTGMSTPITTRLSVNGEEFQANATAMAAMADEVRALHDELLNGGGASLRRTAPFAGQDDGARAHRGPGRSGHAGAGDLPAWPDWKPEDPVGGGVVVAIAEIAHTQCLIIANDPTVRGGTTSPTTIKKLLRAMDVAEVNRLPLVLLVESGGRRSAPAGRCLRPRW